MKKNNIFGQPAGYKRIYNDLIPDGWQLSSLGSKAEIDYGISDAIETTLSEGMKILSLPNVNKDGEFVLNEVPLIARIKVKNDDILKEGDLLFNWRNGSKAHLEKTAYFNLEGEYTHVGFLLRIRSNRNEIDPFFLKSYINFLRNNGFFLGAKIQVNNTFNKEELSDLPLMYPSILEQKAIAKVLSTWDFAIDKSQEIITKKELCIKALLKILLTGKKRQPGFSGEWKYYKINMIADEVSIKNNFDKDLTVLSCTKYDGLVPSLEYFGRKIFADDLTAYKVVPKYHFAYATNHIEEGSLGYQDKFEAGLTSPMYTVFKTNDKINDLFLFKLLKTHKYILEYQKRMEGSIDRRGGLRWDEFSKIQIPVPSLEEQNAITDILIKADDEIALLKQKLEQLKEQKKGLMQVLLTGKKRIKL